MTENLAGNNRENLNAATSPRWGQERVEKVVADLNRLADQLVTEVGPTLLARNAAVKMIEAAQMLETLWQEANTNAADQGAALSHDTANAEHAVREVGLELARAMGKFGPMASPHEGWAVIREELDELWDHVKKNSGRGLYARKEAIQVAAMALRYAVDLCYGPEAATDESWIGAE